MPRTMSSVQLSCRFRIRGCRSGDKSFLACFRRFLALKASLAWTNKDMRGAMVGQVETGALETFFTSAIHKVITLLLG
jgi:hypothetical protein